MIFTIGNILFVLTNLFQIGTAILTYRLIIPRFFGGGIIFIIIRILYALWHTLSMICYYRASFTRAGPITTRELPTPKLSDSLSRECNKCQAWKPPRAHHCRVCGECVFRMDHHCDWINNCVGSHNQKYFILFLLYTFLYSCCTLFINLLGFAVWMQSQKQSVISALMNITLNKVCVGALMFIALFFAVFTADFLYDQLQCIQENQTTVETHKELYGRPGSMSQNMEAIFGKNKLQWFLPTRPEIQMNYMELMYEYQYILEGSVYIEDQFKNKGSQYYKYFQQYSVSN